MDRLVTLEIEGMPAGLWIDRFREHLEARPDKGSVRFPAGASPDALESESRREVALWIQTAATVATLLLTLQTSYHECKAPDDLPPAIEYEVEGLDGTHTFRLPPYADPGGTAADALRVAGLPRAIRLREVWED